MTAEAGAKKKVLVIDDEPDVVKYLEALLKDHDYLTVSAFNGNEGLLQARREKPDLICLDITMPEKSGIRFYRELKQDPALASIPVAVVTAVTYYGGDPEPFRRFLETRSQVPPPEAFIPKPIDREAFLQTVSRLVSE